MQTRNQQQYSPAGSNQRFDEGENSYTSYNKHSSKVVNIDDMPIPAAKARNFEELLEKQLGL